MSIEKVIGIVSEKRGKNCARIEVIGFTKNKIFTRDKNEILNEFKHEGFVFTPSLNFDKFEINSLIEFSINHQSEGREIDKVLMDTKHEPKKVGIPVLTIKEKFIRDDLWIDLSLLNNYDDIFEHTNFYISDFSYLYGPFKVINKQIFPKIGKEVSKYKIEDLISYNYKHYLITSPIDEITKIDCMTQSQIGDWLKDHIKSLGSGLKFDEIKKMLERIDFSGLDKTRLERALKSLNQISLGIDELKMLADNSELLRKSYITNLMIVKHDLKQEVLDPINKEKTILLSDIEKLANSIEKLQDDEKFNLLKVENLKKECELIVKEKDRLINDIIIHSKVKELSQKNSNNILTFEIQIFENKGELYNNLDDFISVFTKSFESTDIIDNNFTKNIIYQLKDSRCLLSNNVKMILNLAKLTNNSKIILQQVEPDWLKFKYLFENGLKQIWESAHESPEIIHFLILQDINMASIECYGKPILDLASGVRVKIPGLNTSWPKNLWLIGIPLDVAENPEFGFPLMKNTFNDWGAFPKIPTELFFPSIESYKYLNLNMLFDHNVIANKYSKDYLNFNGY